MKPVSVMIVDDDVAARDLLSSLLRTQFNAEIEAVADGIEAMRKFRQQTYDIVWMDFEMPGMDGLSAIEIMKTVRSDQFIVMVSAHSDVDTVKKAISLGVGSYIVKPFTTGKVKDAVDKYLQSKAS
jgi:YesN/AraC family two-component response regulator